MNRIYQSAVALLAEKPKTLNPQKCANSYWGRFCDYLKKNGPWQMAKTRVLPTNRNTTKEIDYGEVPTF